MLMDSIEQRGNWSCWRRKNYWCWLVRMSKVDKIRKISSLWREQTKALEKVELEGPTHLPQLGSEESRCKEGPWDGGPLSCAYTGTISCFQGQRHDSRKSKETWGESSTHPHSQVRRNDIRFMCAAAQNSEPPDGDVSWAWEETIV